MARDLRGAAVVVTGASSGIGRATALRFARAGARVALAARGGAALNVASIDGKIPAPHGSAYAASKHAVVAFSGALRQELLLDGARGVHVCTVLPATIDTPLFQHGANYTGFQVRALPPVYAPGQVASVIVELARRPRGEALVGTSAHVSAALFKVAPGLVERFFARTVHRQHLRHRHAPADTPGNAFATLGPHGESGGWRKPRRRRRRAAAFGVGVPLALAAGALWARARMG